MVWSSAVVSSLQGPAIAAAGHVEVDADRWSMSVTPAEDLAPPDLDVWGEDDDTGRATWSVPPVSSTPVWRQGTVSFYLQ